MKVLIFVLLLAIALSACATPAIQAPVAKPNLPAVTLADSAATIPPTLAPPPANTAAASPDTQKLAADLDKTLQDLTTAHQFNGSFLVAKNGQVILSKGYGMADREKKIPNTAQTKFRIGGMTSQFTAIAIMMLQQQGKLNEQDKVCNYLTDCPDSWKAITIHHLLMHMSGIPDRCDVYCGQSIASASPLEQMIAYVKTLPLDFQPGEKYNGDDWVDYTLLGKIIEAVSGQSYETFMQKNIFEPLQMSNTGFDPNRADVAIGYKDQFSVADPVNMWVLFSAAGLYSTAEDLYRYDQALYTGKLLPQQVLDTMFTTYVQSEHEGLGFAYGWYVALDKPRLVKAPSHFNGLDTTFRRYLDDKVAIIYLSNQEDAGPVDLVNSLKDKLVGTTAAISGQNPTASPSGSAPWSLVVVGDSLPFNSPDDCRNCTGFVDRYAAAIIKATGHPVKVQNLSQHTGLQINGLLEELKSDPKRRDALANADIIVVSIAHNDTAWNDNNDPCDGPSTNDIDWSKFNPTCAAAAAEIFRPKFESVFSQIAALRAGKPTIFRTINTYNDWIGMPDVPPEATQPTREVLDAWNAMVCKAAQANSFTCADIYHAFNGSDGLTPSVDFIASDTVHPSDKGNELIARVLADLGYAPLVP